MTPDATSRTTRTPKLSTETVTMATAPNNAVASGTKSTRRDEPESMATSPKRVNLRAVRWPHPSYTDAGRTARGDKR